MAAATAGATAMAGAAASAGMAATPPPPSHGAVAVTEAEKLTLNSKRIEKAAERLGMYFEGRIFDDPRILEHLVYCLARGVDFAISNNSIPSNAKSLPSLIKQINKQCICNDLQPAVMVLMASTKSACRNQWFHAADADELLRMADEMHNIFCSTLSGTLGGINALEAIYKVIPRFYPRLKLCRLVLSLEAQPGYDVLMSDFHIPRDISAGERIKLLVIQTNNLETSSCIVSPPQVSFLVNGKGVEGRTAVTQCNGPQLPMEISKMLKYGTNILQAVGYFGGNYLIAIAFISRSIPVTPVLEDYVQPVDGTSSDSVDASRISLNCPISFRRIKTPVKGHLCKHSQCFDYGDFVEMNSISPYWCCPVCNQSVSFIDLRIDRKIVKILEEVKEGVVDIVISTDGSWKVVAGHRETREKPRGEDGDGSLSDQAKEVFSETDDKNPFRDNQQSAELPPQTENFQSQRSHGRRPSMTRNVSYAPGSVILALPASTNRTVSSHPTRTNVVDSTTSIPSGLPTKYTTYQSDGFSASSSHIEKQQYSTSDALLSRSMPQKHKRTADLPDSSSLINRQQRGAGISQDPMNSENPQHQKLNLAAHQSAERSEFNHSHHPQIGRVAPSGSHVSIQAPVPPDGVMPGHVPPEKGWQASGRMRGSLSAQETLAAINRYFPGYAQAAAVRSPLASAPPSADGIPDPKQL